MTEEENEVLEREREQRELRRWLAFAKRTLHFWPMFLLALALAGVAAAVLLFLMKPAYRSETVILYTPGVGATPAEVANPRNATARLKELLLSRRELSRIVTEFGLYPTVREAYGADDAVDELKRHLEFRAPGGDTFSIAFQGSSPTEAQRVTAALANMVIDGDAKLRKSQTEFARNFLASEKTTKADALKEAEQRLASFMAEHRRFALDQTPLAAGAAIRATLPPLPSAIQAPGQWVRMPASRPRNVPAGAPGQPGHPAAALPSTVSPEEAAERARAIAALAAARANLAEQLGRNTPAHPDVRAAQAALERATARVEALGPEPRFVPAAPQPAPAPRARVQASAGAPVVQPVTAPAGSATAVAGSSEDVVRLETEWLKLTRAVTEARQRLDQVEAALFKADIQASSERTGSGVQISVIDPAYLPQRPIGLSRTAIVAACALAGLVFGLIAAALKAAFDDRILEPRDLGPKVPLLVQVPRLALSGRSHGSG